jgi:hypothetical protein
MLLKESTAKELLLKSPLAGAEERAAAGGNGKRPASGFPRGGFLGTPPPLSWNRLSEEDLLLGAVDMEGQDRKEEMFLLAFSACCCFCFFPEPLGRPAADTTC